MIYLDNHATTPCDPAVVQAMLPYFSLEFGNSSSNHRFGKAAKDALDQAACSLSKLLNCQPSEILFTSGATESNNIAILGATSSQDPKRSSRRKLLTSAIEHKSVLEPLTHLKKRDWEIIVFPVDHEGLIDLTKAEKLIDEQTFMVSVQLANSEIGTIQNIAALSALAHHNGAIMHCDASQALGKTPVDVLALDVDLLSLSAHKIYGPKGIGALFIKEGFIKIIRPIMFGGDQSHGIRPGTQPVALIVGLGKACELIMQNDTTENEKILALRETFEKSLRQRIPGIIINGGGITRLLNNSNITFPGVDAEALLSNLPNIIASTGAACESGSIEPSRVLLSIGLTDEEAYSTIRFGFGRFNTEIEVKQAVEEIVIAYTKLLSYLVR